MPYIGRVIQKSADIRRQTITGSTSATHTLTSAPSSEQQLLITINGLKQHDSAYTITGGTTLNLAAALVATDEMEIVTFVDTGATTIPSDGSVTSVKIAGDAVDASKIAAGAVGASEIASTFDISSKTVTLPSASVTAHVTAFDDNQLKEDIALLAFKQASGDSAVKYNLVDQTVDVFSDASGVNAGASTNDTRNSAGKYYSGSSGGEGGTKTTYGSYTLNTFTSSGTFTAGASAAADILVIAGGGQGGMHEGGGGGGAGGFKYWSQTTVAAGSNTVTVGAGGSTGSGSSAGEDGGISQFASLSSSTGGGGGGLHQQSSRSGGSGGGGTGRNSAAGGAGASNQGNSGGNATSSSTSSDDAGGGGGGASASGSSASGATPAAGGAGYTEGATVYDWDSGSGTVTFPASFYNGSTNSSYAGGGGGGGENGQAATGGTGGGGAGNVNGTDGTGGGGGGNAGALGSAGDGGDGIVIIRYTTGAMDTYVNMTLVSNAVTAETANPTKADLVMTYTNGAGTATIGTDLTAEVTRDGTNWTSFGLSASSDQGDTGGHTILTAHDIDISGQPAGSAMQYRIKTLNQSVSKQTRIHAVSLGWS